MNKRTGLLLAIALLFTSYYSRAGDIMSASCSEPMGVRYDRVGGKLKRNDDRFSGVTPQFVFSKSNPSKLTVIWPDSKTLGASAKQQAHEATVLDINDSMISAVVVYEQQRVNLYTLFPLQGVAFMSTHKNIPLQGGIASGAIFKLECKFEFN
jgi:hypothetical protein